MASDFLGLQPQSGNPTAREDRSSAGRVSFWVRPAGIFLPAAFKPPAWRLNPPYWGASSLLGLPPLGDSTDKSPRFCALVHSGEPSVGPGCADKGSGGWSWVVQAPEESGSR